MSWLACSTPPPDYQSTASGRAGCTSRFSCKHAHTTWVLKTKDKLVSFPCCNTLQLKGRHCLVAVDITGRNEGIMHTTGVFHDCKDGPPLVGQQAITNTRYEAQNERPCVFQAHELLQITLSSDTECPISMRTYRIWIILAVI